jgi:hypothetical protein
MTASSVPGNDVRRLPRPVAAAVWVLAAGVPVGLASLAFATPPPEQDAWAIPLYSLIVATWGLAGGFLVTRRPENRVGWVLLAAGMGVGLGLLGQMWAYLSLSAFEGSLPGAVAGATLGLLFTPALFLTTLVPLLFPDGRLMSRRWGIIAALLLLGSVATLLGMIARPGPIEGMPQFDNPLGAPALVGLSQALIELGGILVLVCLPAGVLAAILRFRRGNSVEREQLKWFGSVLALAFSMFFAAALLPQPYGQWAWIVASLSLGLIPITIGIAILRYRLYEIDRLVSRTIGWAVVTGILVAVFAAVVVALQAALAGFTQGQTLAIAASTLVAAALFQPLRRRVQRAVDRRFDRARYDGERTAAAFAARLRGEVNLEAAESDLQATATAAVQPRTAAVWLRESVRP